MWRSLLAWLGFMQSPGHSGEHHVHVHASHEAHEHGHTHGTVDPTIVTTERGIWAIKWSFVILAITSLLQLAVVIASSSIALLADTIHNVGDAATAIPLWIAFRLARRKPSPRFTYGYGRAEDFAGLVIVLIILFSALVAGYEAIDRLLHPQPIAMLGWVAAAGLFGFIGNEWVAVFRIRVGRQISSAALVADGYHARTDGFTSLAVVAGAAGVWLGFPLADPVVGLLITIAIFGIVWQSAKTVLTRMLDGVDPPVIDEIRHAAGNVPGIIRLLDVRARWLGHRLTAELDAAVDGGLKVKEADALVARLEQELSEHIPELVSVRVRTRSEGSDVLPVAAAKSHSHAPHPILLRGRLASGILEIVDTSQGERMRFVADSAPSGLRAEVRIARANGALETLSLSATVDRPDVFWSSAAPQEPHEFEAQLILTAGDRSDALPFKMVEPAHAH
ncbi:MAG: cation transporter [Betaproteobacteria bacterium]|nr:cation transporter [Betaproteobacteria bacterium]